jgi:hypothetical protein
MVEHSGKTRSRGGVILRVFLNETEGTAMLAVRNQMVLWRDFRLTPGDEANAILAACRTLESLSPHCGIDSKPDAVEIHGRLELKPLVNFDWVEEQLSCPIRWHSNPTPDAGTTAFGLALGGVEDQSQLFDLARTVKPEETARIGFPWRAVAYQALVVLSMAIFLSMHYQQVSTKHQHQLVQNRNHPWLAETTELDLRKQKKDAEIRLSAIRVFLELSGSVHVLIPAHKKGPAFILTLALPDARLSIAVLISSPLPLAWISLQVRLLQLPCLLHSMLS